MGKCIFVLNSYFFSKKREKVFVYQIFFVILQSILDNCIQKHLLLWQNQLLIVLHYKGVTLNVFKKWLVMFNLYPVLTCNVLTKTLLSYVRTLILVCNVQYLYTKPDLAAGCRFITVDAVNEPSQKAISFYKNIGFHFMTDNDEHDETRYMAFDLLSMKI